MNTKRLLPSANDHLQPASESMPWETAISYRPVGGGKVEYTSSFEEWERRHRRKERRQMGALVSVSAVPIGLLYLVLAHPGERLVVLLTLAVFLLGLAAILSANRLR